MIFVGEVGAAATAPGAAPCCTTAGASPATTRCDMPAVGLTLLHVNRGVCQRLRVGERSVLSAIAKAPVPGPLPVGRLGLEGDEQADPSVHGGLDKTLYAYPVEHHAFWQAQRQQHGPRPNRCDCPRASWAKTWSVQGLLEHEVYVGDRCTSRIAPWRA